MLVHSTLFPSSINLELRLGLGVILVNDPSTPLPKKNKSCQKKLFTNNFSTKQSIYGGFESLLNTRSKYEIGISGIK